MRSAALALLLSACATAEPDSEPRLALEDWCPADAEAVEAEVRSHLDAMSLEEKVAQLSGTSLIPNGAGLWPTPTDETHGIPGFRMVDGPRGAHRATGEATAFPVGMARGATWDPVLEQRVGEAIGREVKAKGANVLLAPTVNILRHPLWGRAQETYGEDPHHMGRMGAGFVTGAQTQVIADAKHFAVNSIEDTRFDVSVSIDERALHEVYLPHFKHIIHEAHVGSVMSAYNHVNGPPASESPTLLRDILKNEWGFPGFVVSDWVWAAETTAGSATAGLDVEMPYAEVYGDALIDAVSDGEVSEALVDEAVHRVLRTKLCFAIEESEPDPTQVLTDEARALAREVAERSMVLLKNDGALPVDDGLSVLVTGRLADVANIGDTGSSTVDPPYVITPLQGFTEGAETRAVSHVADALSVTTELSDADVVVVVVGYTEDDEGEGLIAAGDRTSLQLRDEDIAVIEHVATHSDRVLVVIEGGSAVAMPWLDQVEGVLMAWYPGMEGGHALADLIYGTVAPSGRLPISFAQDLDDLPEFDNVSLEVRYDRWHGYTHLDRNDTAPLFAFGFGLTTTTFAYDTPTLAGSLDEDTVEVDVQVTNTGAVEAIETVQVYVGREGSDVVRELRGFAQVKLAPGAAETVSVPVRVADLRSRQDGAWQLEEGTYRFEVGPHSGELNVAGTLTAP
ncbi:MAG: glycoside hydrolase family 3 C-terminal domain-containing protein [Proteobacteria bacterium]|nr:glycoside hydrolase family 3 C-terminal domain-containing protein [Pseudomonadota bacterium]